MTYDDEILKQFFGAYFHQDWMLETSDPKVVINEYVNDHHSIEHLGKLQMELYLLLEEYTDTNVLADALLKKYGCFFDPRLDGQDARTWLQSVIEYITTAIRNIDNGLYSTHFNPH